MKEGSLEAPTRHAIAWTDPDFYDEAKIDAELRRVFDICHGCRRCFNLCDSFPRLFDLIDATEEGEVEAVDSASFKSVVDACTLCDMCFMTKCPYVPPHEFDVDFPHLMLRYRAAEMKKGEVPFTTRQLTETDRNGTLFGAVAPLANWGTDTKNVLTRPVMEAVAQVDRNAAIPKFHGKTLVARARTDAPEVNREAPAFGKRKAVLYATCFINYNNPDIGAAARRVLAKNGVESEVLYPGCCGMPKLEHGDVERVAESAKRVSAALNPYIDRGYDIIALVPSCALMLKFEWPLILPQDAGVKKLADHTWDVAEYVVDIAKTDGLAPGLKPVPGGVAVHLACHARAQNVGPKAADMLRLIPDSDVQVIERCSGHGGSWGMMKGNFEVALKVGRPVARAALDSEKAYVASECPLAALHIGQGMTRLDPDAKAQPLHPIEILARAYGL